MKVVVAVITAALEAVAVALLGVAVLAVPGILLWMISYQLAGPFEVVAALSSAAWLLGHGLPLEVSLTAQQVVNMGAGQAAVSFNLGLPLLGIALLTVWGAFRSGRRIAAAVRDDWQVLLGAAGAGVLGFALCSALAAGFAQSAVSGALWRMILQPAAFYLVAFGAGVWWSRRGIVAARGPRIVRQLFGVSDAVASSAVRLTGDSFVLFTAVGLATLCLLSLLLTVTAIAHFTDYMRLSQSLHLDILGTAVLWLAQLLWLPVLFVWALAWISGAGFSVGALSIFSPFEATGSAVPALPVFAWLPPSWGGFGLLAPLLVVSVALLGALKLGKRFAAHTVLEKAIVTVATAVLSGLVVALLCVLASGQIGPGTLQTTGAHPWLTAGYFALEVGIGIALGMWLYTNSDFLQHGLSQARAHDDTLDEQAPATGALRLSELWSSLAARIKAEHDEELGQKTAPKSGVTEDADPQLRPTRADEESAAVADAADAQATAVTERLDGEQEDAAESGYERLSEAIAEEEAGLYDTQELLRNFEWQADNKNTNE